MTKYEYKTVILKQQGLGFSSRKIPALESTLNTYGKEGWRLREIVIPSAALADSNKVILIFERELVESTDD